jgi:CRISPR-associated endonuclease Cas1
MRAQSTTSIFPKLHPNARVVIVDGYGVRIFVRHGRLQVQDGIGRHRREAEFTRAAVPFKRLIVLGHEGFITLEAVRWLSGVGAAFVQIDRAGKLLATSALPGRDDPRLRRAQAQAPFSIVGVDVARELLKHKIQGQLDIATAMLKASADLRQRIYKWLMALNDPADLAELLQAEAQAATWYWGAWECVRVPFSKKDERVVSDLWTTFGQRRSLHGHGPRAATNPANAMLNYLYALLEAECRLACLAIGLDPGLGIFHTDQQGRDSMALDLMEALRPHADAFLLRELRAHPLRKRDFVEDATGTVRLLAPLTHHLATAIPTLRRKTSPVAEATARILLQRSGRRGRLPTPLTRDNNSAAQIGKRRGDRHILAEPPKLNACRDCGVVLSDRGRLYCDECLLVHRLGRTGDIGAAHARLRVLRAAGADPVSRSEVRRKIGANNRARQRAILEWEARHGNGLDPEVFQREILPGLQRVTVTRMATATGLSIQYCSRIRAGKNVPHPMHWDLLAALVVPPSDR